MSAAGGEAAPRGAGSGAMAGVGFMVGATLLLPTMDAVVKDLVSRYDPFMVIWARYAVHFLMIALLSLGHLRQLYATQSLPLQLGRSALLFGATVTFFIALSGAPLASAVAVMFCSPLIVTALAGPLLGERVGLYRWGAVIVGFAGMLLIVRPGGEDFNAFTLLALCAAVFYSLYQLSTRFLSGSDSPMTTLGYTAMVGAVLSTPLALSAWTPPSAFDAFLLVATGALGGAAHYLLIHAFTLAPASFLTPLNYLSLIWATLWGWLFFSEIPDALTIAGAGVIVGCGLFIAWRERRKRRQRP